MDYHMKGTDAQNNKKITKRFQRTELFAIRDNFVM